MARILAPQNSYLWELQGVRAASTGAFLNNLTTITGEVKDANGVALSPAVTFTFSYVPGSDGVYRAAVPATAALTSETPYRLVVDINAGTDLVAHVEYDVVAQTRKE